MAEGGTTRSSRGHRTICCLSRKTPTHKPLTIRLRSGTARWHFRTTPELFPPNFAQGTN